MLNVAFVWSAVTGVAFRNVGADVFLAVLGNLAVIYVKSYNQRVFSFGVAT